MGLFGKKEKKTCPICGKEMGFLSSFSLSDGNEICEDCENRVRNVFTVHQFTEEERRSNFHLFTFEDNLSDATLDDVKQIIALQEADAAAAKEELAKLGGDFKTSLSVETCFVISPKATEVGLKRAKILKDRVVVQGLVQGDGFQNGDSVTFVSDGNQVTTTALECYKQDVSDFETELAAHTQKKGLSNGEYGWIILDLPQAKAGDIVAK